MMQMKVGSVKGSPVDHFVNKIYPELHYKMRSHYVRDVKDAIIELR